VARSDSNNTVKYLAGSVAVLGIAFCIGYFFIGGSRPQPTPPENLIPSNPPVAAAPVPAKPVILTRTPRTQNGEYTAPGAPSIRIAEDKSPSLVDLSKLRNKATDSTKTPDSEATQEAAPTPKDSLNDSPTPDTAPPDGDATTSGDTPPTPTTTPDNTTPGNTTPDNTASNKTPPPPPNNDPDVEQVGTHPVGPHSDSEAGQEGTSGKAQFRVQAGSFVASENAIALADALRRRGYDTSTHAERDGDKTVYKVQVGAYRNRTAANKAAQDLQSSGYPASVAPIGP
jgi:cell division septation protein DedD